MNRSHKRVLAAYLYDVERNLWNVWRDLQDGFTEPGHILYEVEHDLDDASRTAILDGISSMLKELEEMKLAYELRGEGESSKRLTVAAFAEIWTTLDDLSAKDLTNYGALSSEDTERLNRMVAKMTKILEKMNSAL